MVYYYGNAAPSAVSWRPRFGMKQRTVVWDIEECETDEQGASYSHRWRQVTLEPGIWNYGAIVAAIIADQYTSDEMTAIINNYLLDPTDAGIKGEFDQMQQWRTKAKEIARAAIESEQ